ncbi:helix-turn-helix domain-containing protein [Marinobacter sp. BGYM27]|uniref:transcriptional regulator n=1 Tax=Marinobacter sp. BGYM27 TaxID=2975597 RepID=UPI0021A800BF|nr:helix-turn-helix domain-containing protein [Marinobacter sp. BGYM27]MDG5498936.1 helix-turn-helix domain-containing protein [Marinobacter sp. BGYM27]
MATHALKRAVSLSGGQTSLASACGVKQPYVWNWINRDGRVPAEYVLRVSQATNFEITPHELRPDIYPNCSDGLPIDHAAA